MIAFHAAPSLRDDVTVDTSRFGGTGAASFRIGLAGKKTSDLRCVRKRRGAKIQDTHIVFRYHIPFSGTTEPLSALRTRALRRSFIYLKGEPNYYYLDTVSLSEVNDELFQQNISPNALYLSACAYPVPETSSRAGAVHAGQYASYFAEYATALDAVRNRRYGKQLADSLDVLTASVRKFSGAHRATRK